MSMEEKKILLLEDHYDHAALIIDILQIECIKNEIVLIKDGQEALDYLLKEDNDGNYGTKSHIGLVILDLNLPKVNGVEILKFLKRNQRYHSTPVIILSSSSDQKTIDKVYKNGADDFITKPIYYEEFVEKIKTLIEHQLNSDKSPILK